MPKKARIHVHPISDSLMNIGLPVQSCECELFSAPMWQYRDRFPSWLRLIFLFFLPPNGSSRINDNGGQDLSPPFFPPPEIVLAHFSPAAGEREKNKGKKWIPLGSVYWGEEGRMRTNCPSSPLSPEHFGSLFAPNDRSQGGRFSGQKAFFFLSKLRN